MRPVLIVRYHQRQQNQLRNKYSNKETTVLLKDFVTEDEDNPRHDNAQDLSRAEKPDTRKTRLTLEQISRLRKLSDLKTSEYQDSLGDIKTQFGAPAPEAV